MAELDQALTQAIAEMRAIIDGLIGEQKAICFDLFSQEFAELGLLESRTGLTSFWGAGKTNKTPAAGMIIGGATATAGGAGSSGGNATIHPSAGANAAATLDAAALKRSTKFHTAVIKPGAAENDLQQRLEALRRSLDERAARDRSVVVSSTQSV